MNVHSNHTLKTCYLGKKVYLCTKVPWKSDANIQKVPWKSGANRQKVPWKSDTNKSKSLLNN